SVASALAARRSVRAFQDKPVDPALLRDIFRQAQRAPSGGNLQPWQGVIVTGEPWTAVKQAVAGRIAMGKAGQQPEYDIYPPAITDPWESRRY
ncbi:nitroreductase family protein, partial [Escherichia coli]|nr:nitroreductase family protein [Escherichia coli]